MGDIMAAVEMETATTSCPALMLALSEAGKFEGMVTVISQVPFSLSIAFETVRVTCFTALAPLST